MNMPVPDEGLDMGPQPPVNNMPDDGMDMPQDTQDIGSDEGMPDAPDIESQGGASDDTGKKEVQRLAGELSQKLNEFPASDEELGDYVKGMIEKAVENMLEKDDSQDSAPENIDEPGIQDNMPMESVRFTKGQFKKLNEIFAKKNEKENLGKEKSKKISRKNPFNAPKFK